MILLLAGLGGAMMPAAAAIPAKPARVPVVSASAYRTPVTPLLVVRGFDRGVTKYGAGHRGVDLAAPPGTRVAAAAGGVVSFAGPVAGRGVVVVTHSDGIRTTYEPVDPQVLPGQRVSVGHVVGVVLGTHPGCAASCLHWGARRAAVYVDPLALLAPLGPVRLLAWD